MKNLFKTLMLVGGTTLLLTSQSYINPDESKTASFNTAFELKLDEKVFLPKAKKEIAVTLLKLTDNRCPENVQCVTAGKAVAEITLTNRNGSEATTKLVLDHSANSTDTVSVKLDETSYYVILNEVNRLFANKVKIIVRKASI